MAKKSVLAAVIWLVISTRVFAATAVATVAPGEVTSVAVPLASPGSTCA